jgi:hypothetical protein
VQVEGSYLTFFNCAPPQAWDAAYDELASAAADTACDESAAPSPRSPASRRAVSVSSSPARTQASVADISAPATPRSNTQTGRDEKTVVRQVGPGEEAGKVAERGQGEGAGAGWGSVEIQMAPDDGVQGGGAEGSQRSAKEVGTERKRDTHSEDAKMQQSSRSAAARVADSAQDAEVGMDREEETGHGGAGGGGSMTMRSLNINFKKLRGKMKLWTGSVEKEIEGGKRAVDGDGHGARRLSVGEDGQGGGKGGKGDGQDGNHTSIAGVGKVVSSRQDKEEEAGGNAAGAVAGGKQGATAAGPEEEEAWEDAPYCCYTLRMEFCPNHLLSEELCRSLAAPARDSAREGGREQTLLGAEGSTGGGGGRAGEGEGGTGGRVGEALSLAETLLPASGNIQVDLKVEWERTGEDALQEAAHKRDLAQWVRLR